MSGMNMDQGSMRHRQVGHEGGLGGSRVGRLNGVMTTARDPIYAGHRYPAEIISYAVWLYFRFPLSLRMVEEMLAARGISVTHETIRQWGLKFGREFANRIRRRAPCRGDKWHSMRLSSASPGRSTGCGVPSTRTASFSIFSSRADATRRPPNACSAAPQKAGSNSSCARHRQAEELCRGQAGDYARGRAPAAQRPQ